MPKQHEELLYISSAFALSAFSFLIYKVYKTKNTYHLDFLWIFLLITADVLMFIYGNLNHIHGLYIPAIIYIIGLSYILYIKIVYKETNIIK
jgi:uncharacterized protein with PQ loop repeat